ncbi:MAG: nucleotidyl transferase AbiEii/AbiGii toxin family protein [Lachnospiraceae bacterium]|nr:nucleotidyl transferase AbiEii/AbiGii toxin family protein [Lachnospiraceae bacterium]
MNWYREYQAEWKEIIETVARELGRSEQMVEKDTIQSMFLFELAKSELPFVFKGGTSLSKAYNLIDRFSEDIDLSMNRRPTQSERVKSKELIIEIAENLGLVLSNPEEIKSRYDYNKYVFKYDSLFSVIRLEIIIETSYYQSVYPVDKHVVGSFVGRFCLDRNIILPVPFEAAEVMMNVQSVERTFVDKVFAVCDYKIQNMQDRDSRHLYDICKLLREVELNEELDKLIDMVRDDRMQSKNNPSAQLEYFIPDMLKEIIRSRFYEPDYKNVTQKLLYEDISYDYAIENGIAIIAESDVFVYNSTFPPVLQVGKLSK